MAYALDSLLGSFELTAPLDVPAAPSAGDWLVVAWHRFTGATCVVLVPGRQAQQPAIDAALAAVHETRWATRPVDWVYLDSVQVTDAMVSELAAEQDAEIW